MKHLKLYEQFNVLRESLNDGEEIMDAIRNSPEGRDLCAVMGIEPGAVNLANTFLLKRTGRVHVLSAGSKTYLEKDERSGTYYFESVSSFSGKFGREDYPTIPELLRGLWTNIVGKRSTSLGIKKDEIRKWMDSNITPGQGLEIRKLQERFIISQGKELPDLSEIFDNRYIKMMGKIFPEFGNNSYLSDGVHLSYNLNRPFGMDLCGGRDYYTVEFFISVKANGKSTLKSEYNQYRIILTNTNSVTQDFENLFREAVSSYLKDYMGEESGDLSYGSCEKFLLPLSRGIIDSILGSNSDSVGIINVLEYLKNNYPLLFSDVITGMEKASLFPEITKKFREESGETIRGGRLLRTLGI